MNPVHTRPSYFSVLSSHLRLGIPSVLFPSGFLTKILCILLLPHAYYIICPSYPPNYIWRRVQVTTFLIIPPPNNVRNFWWILLTSYKHALPFNFNSLLPTVVLVRRVLEHTQKQYPVLLGRVALHRELTPAVLYCNFKRHRKKCRTLNLDFGMNKIVKRRERDEWCIILWNVKNWWA
jgi:hypothetical protein